MSSLTPRLGLTLPSDPEPQDIITLTTDFTAIDAAVGIILVNDGVTPPNSQLYDGAVVKEKTSGLVWVAQKNVGTGNYDKNIIVSGPTTPWLPLGYAPGWASPNGTVVDVFEWRCSDGMVYLHGQGYYSGTAQAINSAQTLSLNNAGLAATINPALGGNYLMFFPCVYRIAGSFNMNTGAVIVQPTGALQFDLSVSSTGIILNLDGICWKDYRYN